jgi:hypothetical protein
MLKGWLIIVATFSSAPNPVLTKFDQMTAKAKTCHVRIFNDFSGKFKGFAPGSNVFVVDHAFHSKKAAERQASIIQKCFPGAYVKHGEYLGE